VRRRLAARAFAHVSAYDAAVARWLDAGDPRRELLPATIPIGLRRVRPLRYGENPHQPAALYDAGEGGRSLALAEPVQGKELSFNNLADLDAAVRAVFELPHAGPEGVPAVAIVKHLNPCGIAAHPEGIPAAFRLALSADPVSAYGGIVALNRPLDGSAAAAILDSGVFFEAIAAPGVTAEARERCARRPNLRVLALPERWGELRAEGTDARRIQGAWLLQGWDVAPEAPWSFSGRDPSEAELRQLRFAWAVVRAVRSNAIVLACAAEGGWVTNGVGAGQMNRVESVGLAVARATRPVAGNVLASDAFFPFADGVERALAAGVRAFVQPGGSIRDAEVREAVERGGATMAWSGVRHFRH
jgi:phosphoribosylaminoimidazolecarboxamide formyltransferase/IMP cyclohydrolase